MVDIERAIDLFEIDLKSGKNWLAHGKEMQREKIRKQVRAKHRARHVEQQIKLAPVTRRTR